jgi:ABC-2 type transport system permease protein
MAAASFAYWPAVLLMMGVMVFLLGFLPRLSTSLTWAVYGVSMLVAMFGGLFSLSEAAIRATPFGAIPRMPAQDFVLLPIVVLAVIAVVLAALGVQRFSSRDIVPE